MDLPMNDDDTPMCYAKLLQIGGGGIYRYQCSVLSCFVPLKLVIVSASCEGGGEGGNVHINIVKAGVDYLSIGEL